MKSGQCINLSEMSVCLSSVCMHVHEIKKSLNQKIVTNDPNMQIKNIRSKLDHFKHTGHFDPKSHLYQK